jgi:Na+-driven multidrug efflux pump
MFTLTLLCQWRADVLIRLFAHDSAALTVGSEFLHVISWNFVATGIIFTCSGMFQALGNTMPALISSATRVAIFAVPAIWLSSRGGFALHQLWLLSVTTVIVQMSVSLLLLRRALSKTKRAPAAVGAAPLAVGA